MLSLAQTLGDQYCLTSKPTWNLQITLKLHVIIDHYSDYFMWTGRTMKYTNAEFTETAHSTFKMSERIHKFKVTRKIGTPVHKELALKSLVWHNSKRAGYVSPAEFRLRTSSPGPGVSPLSSPRIVNSVSLSIN